MSDYTLYNFPHGNGDPRRVFSPSNDSNISALIKVCRSQSAKNCRAKGRELTHHTIAPCVAVTSMEFQKWLRGYLSISTSDLKSVGLVPASSRISEKLSHKLCMVALENVVEQPSFFLLHPILPLSPTFVWQQLFH